MIVNIDAEDRTWQFHLEALLNILSRPLLRTSIQFTTDASTLGIAININNHENPFQELSKYAVPCLKKLFSLLDFTMLHLRSLASRIEALLHGSTPRKLDVQKARASVKQLQTNIKLFSKICPPAELSTANLSSANTLVNLCPLCII